MSLLDEFKKHELDSSEKTTIKAGTSDTCPGTNCEESAPTTTCGGVTTSDQDWICDDELPEEKKGLSV